MEPYLKNFEFEPTPNRTIPGGRFKRNRTEFNFSTEKETEPNRTVLFFAIPDNFFFLKPEPYPGMANRTEKTEPNRLRNFDRKTGPEPEAIENSEKVPNGTEMRQRKNRIGTHTKPVYEKRTEPKPEPNRCEENGPKPNRTVLENTEPEPEPEP